MKLGDEMNTIDELLYYCRESEPVGAVLLSGEWGCGKTYLVDHELKAILDGEAVILRISLFGITRPEEIHDAVKSAWMETYYRIKGLDSIVKNVKKFKRVVETAQILPEPLKGILATDPADFFSAKNKIDDKYVVLVFDDLERCQMNSVDVLGIINDYCENGQYHTIIVANQEKIRTKQEPTVTGEIQFSNAGDATEKGNIRTAQGMQNVPAAAEQGELSYAEIKEKIVQRTVQYIPDYKKIVHTVITSMKYENSEYKAFIESCESGLLELFAPDRDDLSYGKRLGNNALFDSEEQERLTPPHNIRSLKCAIKDFYRIYCLLIENEVPNLSNWLYSFTSYTIAYKADIVQDDIFSDDTVRKLYPAFQSKYMLSGAKQWIFHGIWDEDFIQKEIIAVKEQAIPRSPAETIKSLRIMDIDDSVLQDGFSDFLVMAYSGNLTLEEYVRLVENSCWARKYQCPLPESIDWSKVNTGVDLAIGKIKETLPEGQILHLFIDKKQREYFTNDEWSTYERIAQFAFGNELMFLKNRKLYIDKMNELGVDAFLFVQNKRFDLFDEEMARVTALAFTREHNMGKDQFVASFRQIWKANIHCSDMRLEETVRGFLYLKKLLLESISAKEGMTRTFSAVHTEEFIKTLDELADVSSREDLGSKGSVPLDD